MYSLFSGRQVNFRFLPAILRVSTEPGFYHVTALQCYSIFEILPPIIFYRDIRRMVFNFTTEEKKPENKYSVFSVMKRTRYDP